MINIKLPAKSKMAVMGSKKANRIFPGFAFLLTDTTGKTIQGVQNLIIDINILKYSDNLPV